MVDLSSTKEKALGALSGLEDVQKGAQGFVSDLTDQLSVRQTDAVAGATRTLSAKQVEILDAVSTTTSQAAQAVDSFVQSGADAVAETIDAIVAVFPPEVQQNAKVVVTSFAGLLDAFPPSQRPYVVLSLTVGLPSYLYWRGNFAGFAGKITAKKALDAMGKGT